MEGLVEEGLEQAGEIERRPVLDAAIIGAEQKAEHSKSPHMERLLRWEQLDQQQALKLLLATLEEEKAGQETDDSGRTKILPRSGWQELTRC